jgi:hypothetical protein
MEGSCSTGQSPQWAVVPVEEEEEEEEEESHIKFHELGGDCSMRTDGQTDAQTDIHNETNSSFSPFCERA